MPRNNLQPGPSTDHYHETLGVDEVPVAVLGATPTLAEVLVAGNDPGGTAIEGAPSASTSGAVVNVQPGASGGWFNALGGNNAAGSGDGGTAEIVGGASASYNGASVAAGGATPAGHGRASVYTNDSDGNPGQVLTSDGTYATWKGVQVAAAVPSGAPTGNGFAYDTTAVTGGFYFWNGSAWVKVANIL